MIAAISMLLFFGLSSQLPDNGSICGTVRDQTGASVAGVPAQLAAGETRHEANADAAGGFCFRDLEPREYQLAVQVPGFRTFRRKITLHEREAVLVSVALELESVAEQVTVAEGAADVGSVNVAETHVGEGLIQNLPSESVNARLSSILTLATPGVAADSNGVFHPLGEHAETSFSVDGQPISDQQSRIFSNQISASAIQDMRTLQGAPPAEFGDKTSLIVEATTRSGLNTGKPSGSVSLGYGSFQTPTASITLATGSSTFGNFVALDGIRSLRFLDTPEFAPLHARGDSENFFDRFDWRPSAATSMQLNATAARSWFQVPNTYDQQMSVQDQRQHMGSFNLGLAASHTFSAALLLTANSWLRQDRVDYLPSPNAQSDQPAVPSQSRRLTNTGFRGDLSYSHGRHTAKGGMQIQITPLSEAFRTGLTDPAFNSPCQDASGAPVSNAALASPDHCAASGYSPNVSYQPALAQYDLTRGGTLFQFRGAATIHEESAYVQDSISLGSLSLNLGVRYDYYSGLSMGWGAQPRLGLAYQLHSTGTVLHISYARVFLTPYNENLVLSSSTGAGGLASSSLGASSVEPLTPAQRNQYNAGFEQRLGRQFNLQAEYFWKFTAGAYDFNSILNTPLNFPIQFRKSKIDGALIRATLSNVHGFSAFTVLGHSRSRLFGPEIGGINFGAQYEPVARPDHDQNFEQSTNLQYQFSPRELLGLWLGLTWRYDSGLVVVSVPDYATALTLTGDQQQEIGLYCGSSAATVEHPLRTCSAPNYGATLIRIVPPGTYNPDTNPSRIAPRNLFDLALGSRQLWKRAAYSVGGKITIVNLMNKIALYNFLSSFSGTHFVAPRTVQAELTLSF